MPDERDYNVETVDPDSPAPIAHAVRGVDFPCSRDDLLEQAKKNGARDEVIEAIEGMPDEEYESMADVFSGVGESNDEDNGGDGDTEEDEED